MPFDPTIKGLLEVEPADWLQWLRLPAGSCRWIDADLSAVTSEADKVLRIDGPRPWVLHLEFQADHDLSLVARMYRYHGLLYARHRADVHSVAVLLRKAAQASNLTGTLSTAAPGGPESTFGYTVVRLWEQPVEPLLTGGIGVLPLAPLAAVTERQLPGVVARIGERLASADPGYRATIWAATHILMGLSWEKGLIDRLLRGVKAMKSSVTYQAILSEGREEGLSQGREEGRVEGARDLLIRLGQSKFGRAPTARQRTVIAGIAELAELEALAEGIIAAHTWSDLLAGR